MKQGAAWLDRSSCRISGFYIFTVSWLWITSTTSGMNPHSGHGSLAAGPLHSSLQRHSYGSLFLNKRRKVPTASVAAPVM